MNRLIQTKSFLDEISVSIKIILFKAFPKASGEDREDIEQEVKLKLWKMIDRGKPIRSLKPYLWRVVYTTAIDFLEKRLDHQPLDDHIEEKAWSSLADLSSLAPDKAVERLQSTSRLMEAVGRLPQRRRIVLKLHLAGLDIDEISASLDWSTNQVRHLYYRALEELKRNLNPDNGNPSMMVGDGS